MVAIGAVSETWGLAVRRHCFKCWNIMIWHKIRRGKRFKLENENMTKNIKVAEVVPLQEWGLLLWRDESSLFWHLFGQYWLSCIGTVDKAVVSNSRRPGFEYRFQLFLKNIYFQLTVEKTKIKKNRHKFWEPTNASGLYSVNWFLLWDV